VLARILGWPLGHLQTHPLLLHAGRRRVTCRTNRSAMATRDPPRSPSSTGASTGNTTAAVIVYMALSPLYTLQKIANAGLATACVDFGYNSGKG